jgi:hypothetical protein
MNYHLAFHFSAADLLALFIGLIRANNLSSKQLLLISKPLLVISLFNISFPAYDDDNVPTLIGYNIRLSYENSFTQDKYEPGKKAYIYLHIS